MLIFARETWIPSRPGKPPFSSGTRHHSSWFPSRRRRTAGTWPFSGCLAFIPQFQSSYLKESHFLGRKFLKRCHIDYWSFLEDVSGFEKIFAKHDDEFVGTAAADE